MGVFYYTFDGLSGVDFPALGPLRAEQRSGRFFQRSVLLGFLSSATDNGNDRRRVLGDYIR